MAKKKSRRARRKRAVRATRTGAAASAGLEKKAAAPGPARATAMDFAEQYDYVYDDLKRIAVLAGAMFAILIALSFVVG